MQTQLLSHEVAHDWAAQQAEAQQIAALRKAADDDFQSTAVLKDTQAVRAHAGHRAQEQQAARETAQTLDSQACSPVLSRGASLPHNPAPQPALVLIEEEPN